MVRRLIISGAVAWCASGSPAAAAEKPGDKPDPEMLRMIEFLKDWEMFKNMELLKEMQQVRSEAKNSEPTARNAPTPRPKESAK